MKISPPCAAVDDAYLQFRFTHDILLYKYDCILRSDLWVMSGAETGMDMWEWVFTEVVVTNRHCLWSMALTSS